MTKFDTLFFPHDHKSTHLKSLDGLRGLAVLFVLLSHTSNAGMYIHKSLDFQRIGKVGVYLFFVLSAYLLDRQIAIALRREQAGLAYWKNYFLRRFLRIYPLFVIAVFFFGVFTLMGIPTVINQSKDIPLHLLLLRGENIFWSIPVEFKYYFLSPLLMWFCHRGLRWDRRKLLLALSGAVAVSVLAAVAFELPSVSTFRYLPVFLVGTAVAIYELLAKKGSGQLSLPFVNWAGLLALGAILLTIPTCFAFVFGVEVNFHHPVFYLPYALLWALVLLSAKYGNGLLRRLLEVKILRFFGAISFSMYLFHILFLKLVQQSNVPDHLQLYVFVLCTVLFSSASYLLIERPLSTVRLHSLERGAKASSPTAGNGRDVGAA
ncbi:MAG: acyltransferase [Bacteroidota bacterium]